MYTSLHDFDNLSVDWPINSFFSKYDVTVLSRVISILGMIILAVGWVVEVAVLCKDNISDSKNNLECFRPALLCRWSFYKGG